VTTRKKPYTRLFPLFLHPTTHSEGHKDLPSKLVRPSPPVNPFPLSEGDGGDRASMHHPSLFFSPGVDIQVSVRGGCEKLVEPRKDGTRSTRRRSLRQGGRPSKVRSRGKRGLGEVLRVIGIRVVAVVVVVPVVEGDRDAFVVVVVIVE
jgi:hypothetical protein